MYQVIRARGMQRGRARGIALRLNVSSVALPINGWTHLASSPRHPREARNLSLPIVE